MYEAIYVTGVKIKHRYINKAKNIYYLRNDQYFSTNSPPLENINFINYHNLQKIINFNHLIKQLNE